MDLNTALADTLDDLHRQEPATAQHIEALLNVLEDAPGDSRVRRPSIRASASPAEQGPVWGFTVRGRDTDYLVLWRTVADDVEVLYIGGDVFKGGRDQCGSDTHLGLLAPRCEQS